MSRLKLCHRPHSEGLRRGGPGAHGNPGFLTRWEGPPSRGTPDKRPGEPGFLQCPPPERLVRVCGPTSPSGGRGRACRRRKALSRHREGAPGPRSPAPRSARRASLCREDDEPLLTTAGGPPQAPASPLSRGPPPLITDSCHLQSQTRGQDSAQWVRFTGEKNAKASPDAPEGNGQPARRL